MIKRVLLVTTLSLNYIFASPLSYINSIRKSSGLMPLSYNSNLALAAKKHAIYVNKTKEFSHYERKTSKYYFASTPWYRIVKAGYKTKVVVENITFVERNYKESIDNLMATVYHRLAFLYNQIDNIGYAKSGTIFVYDMSNSKDIVPATLFNKAINKMKRESKDIIVYPYKNQKNVPILGAEETPRFLYSTFGHPITATFNSGYYKNIRLLEFKLFNKNRKVPAKIVSSKNDINSKIRKGTFVLVPMDKLKSNTTYKVVLKAKLNGKIKTLKWYFTTR